MANLFTNMMNNIGDWMAAKIAPYISDGMGRGYSVLSSYYTGDHRPQLKVQPGKADDNIALNFIGLAVDRSVSRLFRGGVEFNLPEGADDLQEYIDAVWDLNKKEILLYQLGLHGAVYGTTYLKISPDGLVDPYTGDTYPRLIAVDPEIIRVKVNPQDMHEVEEYRIEYSFKRGNNDVSYREITRRSRPEDYEDASEHDSEETWVVEHYEQVGSGPWMLIDSMEWPYSWPPIHHWKNLPSLKSCYGSSDIDDAINVQDKENFVVSNTGKIIKFHAHPEVIGTGFSVDQMKNVDTAVGTFRAITNENAKVYTIEMESDLASSRNFAQDLRQSIFDISREVDISSIGDKVGALTNFGLRVLYTDAIDKNDTKRQLYGDAFKEINRRLLELKGKQGLEINPGEVAWGDALIVDTKQEMEVDQLALNMGVVDLETVTRRYEKRYGVDYETIQANRAKQKQNEVANRDIGAELLRRRFSQGQ